MRFTTTTIVTLLTVGLAAAQSQSRRATCAAQNILDACIQDTSPQLQACEANDWDCLCEQSNNVLTCYNNCPGDDGQFGAQQTMTSYCNAAKAYGSSTSSSISATPSASAASAASASSTSTGSFATKTASSGSSNLVASASSSSTSSSSNPLSTSSDSAAAASVMVNGWMIVQGGLVAAMALGLGVAL
ncbi:hypothetical protein UA08_05509 [Talaromyces atroroseus]|uniref:GPI anchored serine-threonine rich protein n=1 Tax=Talaromyces atroroseus TaxID=1441469 RepID=A0A225APQ5_TALAT|nr:hypothetical protein UA08_05509 [Talaromyces atroroseus]OKL59258.1 hypothetical protein UA08_05509 [Talaromyces atroroseus]